MSIYDKKISELKKIAESAAKEKQESAQKQSANKSVDFGANYRASKEQQEQKKSQYDFQRPKTQAETKAKPKAFAENYQSPEQRWEQFRATRREFETRHGSNVWKMRYDFTAGQKEIDDLEAELRRLRMEKLAQGSGVNSRPYAAGQTEVAQYTTGYGITNNRPYAAGQQAQREFEPTDDRIRELEMQIAQKKQAFNQAKQYQKEVAYDDTVKNADFDQYDDYAESDDTLYNWINNPQFRESYEASYQSIPNPNARRSKYTRKGYDRMYASEIAIYNYYYAKSGKEAAQKYLDTIQERLNERTAEEMYSTVQDNTAAEIVFGAAVGANQFITNVANNFRFKDDYIPQSAYQIAGKMADEGLADASIPLWYNIKEGKWEDKVLGRSLGQIAYDAVTTGANMAPSILVGMATGVPVLGTAAMGLSASGGAYQQALNEGYDKNQARGYSMLVGTSEMAMEKLLGGISAVGGNALGRNAVKNIANADTALKAIAKRVGGSALSEFGEEYLQEVLDPVFSNIMLKTDKEVKPISAEALYSGILGMLTGAIMESPSAIYGEAQTARTGRKLKEAGGVDSLEKIGNTFAADTVAYKLAGKVNENTGAYTIGQLLKEVGATLTEQNVNEIAEALMKENIGEIAAKKYAQAFAYVVEGGAMPDSMVNAIEADTVLAKAAREVLIDSNTTWNQRTQGYNEVLRKLAMDKVTGKTAPTSKARAPADNTAEAKTESGAEGNVEPAKYGSIQTIKNGKVTVKMTDGTEVDLKDADLDPDDSVRIETIASIDGISAEDASGIFNILKAGSKNPQYDANGAREAYRYGYYGLTENHLNENGTFSKSLTPEQRKAVYEIGRKARDASVTAEIGKIKQMHEAAAQKEPAKLRITYNQGNGVVQDIESKTITGLSRKQRAAVSFAKVLHQLGVGTDFEFFESYLSKTLKDKNGNRARVFLDDSGNEVIAYSGVHQTADDKIRIDLNAYSGRGLALNAMSHELVHFIKKRSPDRYRTMADIVGNAYGNTQMSMHQRVLREQARLERIRGTEVSYDEAYDEVVANALNRMLDDGTVLDRIAEIRKVDGGLADMMIDCIRKFIKRFAKVFSDNESLFYDTEDLMQFKDTVEELRGMFAEALVEASDNRLSSVETEAVESLGENATVETNEDGQLLLAKNESGNVLMYSEQTYQMGGRDKYSTQETDNITARDLLSSTDVATIKNEVVKKKLSDYQKILEVNNAEDQKLREIRAEIKELSFAKGARDTKKLKDLKFEAIKINNHISVYEGQLQRMEKELQSVVKRERAKVVKEAEKRDKAVLAKEWMDAQVKQNETLREYREIRAALRQQESDTAIMEKEFVRIVKEYEKLDAKRGKTISGLRTKLKNEAESHRADEKMWMAEFGRLMREYDAADRNIDKLEQKIERQKAAAKERVENRNKTAMRHKIQNVVKELNGLLLTNDKKRRVPDNLKKAVAAALDLVNMDTVDAENRAAKYADLIAKEQAKANPDQDKIDSYTMTMENILRQGEKMGQRIKELHAAYEEIQNSDDPDIANAYDPVIAGAIQELSATIGNTSIKNMTMEQLSDVYDVYRAVLTRVRDANKAMAENIKASIEELAKSTIREVQSVGGSQKYRISALDAVRKFDWNNMKPVCAMERIGSSTLTEVFNNVRAGEDTWAKDVSEAREYYLEKSKKYGYDKWDFDKKYRFESNSGIPFELTLEQILSLYAYSKREQAADHLRLGGFVFDSNIETYKEKAGKKSLLKYKVNTADAHQITPEIMADIIGKLSKEQAGFVDEMQDYLSTVMGAKGNEVTSKMYGVKLFKEKFYFPLKSAKQFMFEQNEVSGEVRIKNSGFTNKVVAKANNPVILSNFMDVWSGHVNDMSMYHAFTLPLEDFNRVFNYNSPKKDGVEPVSVKGTIQNAYGPAAASYVKQLITDLNGGARTDSTTGVINKLTGMFKKGAVFASLSVVVQQTSAIAKAAALVDTKYFIGPKVDQKRHKYLWAEVKKYAPVAIIKEMGYFDTNMGKSTQDFITGKEYSGIKEKAKAVVTDSSYRDELLSKAPALADEYAWCGIWAAVKRETKAKHPSMDTTSEAFLKLAGKRFTEVITKTQVYDSVLARSANMRSKDTGMKMATAFMAEPTTSINMIEDALWKAKRGDKKYAGKAIGAVIASQILNAILVSFVYAGRDDDEDETYAEKYIGALTGSLVDGLNVATYIPFIKDIVSITQGYDVERSDMAVVSDLWNAWKNLKNDKVSPYRKVENFAGSIAQIFGLPVKNIMRDVRGIYNTITNLACVEQTTGSGVKYAISGAITGKTVSDKEQLYKARLDGDKQHAARVAARYDDEDSADAAVRAAIKDSFMADEIDEATALKHMVLYAGMDGSEAHWTMDAWKYRKKVGSDEGYGKYGKFHDAVRSGKNLESVIKEYTDNGVKTSTLTGEITDEFKPVYLEASNSERAAMKTKLISAYVACDMEREDAEKKLESWDFEAEYGFAYSDRKETYLSGKVSKATLVDILIDRGYDEEDAEAQVEAYEWEAAGFEDVTTSAIRNYNEWCEPAGIPKSVYLEFWRFDNSTENDVDKTTGKKIAYSAVKKIMAYINSLNLTDRQKDALAKSTGWADKTIKKYKLW